MTNILIPIKSLSYAKQRLSSVLTANERAGLVLAMFQDVLSTLSRWNKANVLVVSSDAEAISLANSFGARAITEVRSNGYNEAIVKGFRELDPDRSVLVLPGDLPSANFEDLKQVVQMSDVRNPEVRIVPDQRRLGTNALYLSSPFLINPSFGLDSFERHIEAAKGIGAEVSIHNLASLARDIDTPDDLRNFAALNLTNKTSDFLTQIGFRQDASPEPNGKVA